MSHTRTVLVIGGGAAGMMAAVAAARAGAQVTLLEKNHTFGKKLRITGGGRCNIYNAEPNLRTLLQNYGAAEQSLYSAYTAFGNDSSETFFADIGVPTKVEARQRAFPVSERAEDVANALYAEIQRLQVNILPNTTVQSINRQDGEIVSVQTNTGLLKADRYILATGGLSKPETGSNGDGFGWLQQLGHTVVQPTPTITPLRIADTWVHKLSGKTLQDVALSAWQHDTQQLRIRGDVLCAHFGLSGPTILNNSSKIADLLQSGPVQLRIDMYPDLDHKQLDELLLSTLQQNPTKQLQNALKLMTQPGIQAAIAQLAPDIDMQTKTSEVSKQSRKQIVHVLKALPANVQGLMGFDKAVVADGGVDIAELDMRTMQSTIATNLYIVGDLLNIRRPSGGYSLQLCWTTGYIAGLHAAQSR